MSEKRLKKKKKIGLIPKLLIALVLGAIVGQMTFLPQVILQIPVTISSIFSSILNFFIPLMIVGFIVKGVSDLSEGAGKLLGLTTGMAYLSTIIAGFMAYFVGSFVFPFFIDGQTVDNISEEGAGLQALFEIPVDPMFSVTAAIVFAFMFGIGVSWLRNTKQSYVMYNFFDEFADVINLVLKGFIVPLIPVFIFGNVVNLSYTGTLVSVVSVFWRVFIVVLSLHFVLLFVWYLIAGSYTGKNPFTLIKHQIPAYLTAVGTQSSAATIPVNLETSRKNGVTKKIRDFVIPFGATVHLLGSIITVTSCVLAVLMIYDMPYNFGILSGFILILGIAMVAAPGAPGGAIMSALPFLGIVGIDPSGTIASLLITLYLAQDSFGTAANISGDSAIALVVDKIFVKHISVDPNIKVDPTIEKSMKKQI